jgi:hypothetical protein
MWKCLTTKFLENQKHELGFSGHFKTLRNETILNVYVRHSTAEVQNVGHVGRMRGTIHTDICSFCGREGAIWMTEKTVGK